MDTISENEPSQHDLVSQQHDLEPQQHDLEPQQLDLGSQQPDLGSHQPELDSQQPDLESEYAWIDKPDTSPAVDVQRESSRATDPGRLTEVEELVPPVGPAVDPGPQERESQLEVNDLSADGTVPRTTDGLRAEDVIPSEGSISVDASKTSTEGSSDQTLSSQTQHAKIRPKKYTTPPPYTIPLPELRKAALGEGMPDLSWPPPYTDVFHHLLKKPADDLTSIFSLYTTDIENKDKCVDEFDFAEATEYMLVCKHLGIIPSTHFMRSLRGSELRMKYRGIGPLQAPAMCVPLATNTNIETIDLEQNRISEQGGLRFGDVLRSSYFLKYLNLAWNKLGDEGTKSILSALSQNNSLEVLNLAGNEINDRTAPYIASALLANDHLFTLNLSHNKLGERSGPTFQLVLSKNDTVENLDLSWNRFRGPSAVRFIKGLTVGFLVQLDLSYNGISDSGAAALTQCLSKNETLVKLNITANRISKKGAQALAKGLKKNGTLKVLSVGKNPLTPEGASLLLEAAHSPASVLKELNLSDVSINLDFLDKLFDLTEKRKELWASVQHYAGEVAPTDLLVKHGRVYSMLLKPIEERKPPVKEKKKKKGGKKKK